MIFRFLIPLESLSKISEIKEEKFQKSKIYEKQVGKRSFRRSTKKQNISSRLAKLFLAARCRFSFKYHKNSPEMDVSEGDLFPVIFLSKSVGKQKSSGNFQLHEIFS